MSEIELKARALRGLIDEYWALAYAEGQEGRTHDTEAGDAQRVSMEIDKAIREALTPPDGFVLVPVEMTKEIDAALQESIDRWLSTETAWGMVIRAARPEVDHE